MTIKDSLGTLRRTLSAARQIAASGGSVEAVSDSLSRIERDLGGALEQHREELLKQAMQTRLLMCRRLWQLLPADTVEPLPMVSRDFDADLEQLSRMHPQIFNRWKQINFVDNPIEFAERPAGSCSVGLGRFDTAFAGFIAPYLQGRVLDLGCGPQPVPSYLQGYPARLISGLDPLEPFSAHPFQFHRGFGEFMPWPDAAFDIVINATSLDHSFSLDLVTREIVRVLRPGGRLLVWEGFVAGSPPYNPSDPALEPVDQFHLFHFDENWFERHFSASFDIVEKIAMDSSVWNPQYCTNHFYALRRRPTQA